MTIVQESLSLVIKYRMLREGEGFELQKIISLISPSEVESLVKHTVEEVVKHLPPSPWHSDALVHRIVDLLENNADWVELYGVTGELIIPDVRDDDHSEFDDALSIVKKVPSYSTYFLSYH